MKKKTKICIIGLGRFGSLVASILKSHFEVEAIEINQKEAQKRAQKIGIKLTDFKNIGEFDVVILTVPISETETIIKKLASGLKKRALLIDACSVKTLPCKWMKKYASKDVEILGTHPMFGPTTSKFDLEKQDWQIKGLQIILCPVRISQKRLACVKSFLNKMKLEIIEATPGDHDKQNAKTLALVHFIGRSLVASDVKEQKIFTPGYADLLKIIPRTASDNWQLFYDMNNYNPYAEKIRNKFIQSCNELDFKVAKSQGADNFDSFRNIINSIDQKIFWLFKKRFKVSEKIGKFKKKDGLPIKDRKREDDLIQKRASESKLEKSFIEKMYKIIFNQSIKLQKNNVIKKNSKS
ncbi:MAG: prephenate dehydrogenase/arogenate dehydrogenase family protein [Patescibacteria group bacterium]|jgi:prephenate dehydrogenase|nr:prephenate dehydrogenase/arogenate dehydrogenase family protein [Patescibacteria group bacterium]